MEDLDCSYHVYKIVDKENDKHAYVADGTGTRSHEYEFVGPVPSSDLDGLAKTTVREHLDYLKRKDLTVISKLEDLYMSFSFTPTCQSVFQMGRFYSTHPLNEKEQEQFCNGIKKVYKALDRSIDLEKEGNPLD